MKPESPIPMIWVHMPTLKSSILATKMMMMKTTRHWPFQLVLVVVVAEDPH
jgi:hypothetical protein